MFTASVKQTNPHCHVQSPSISLSLSLFLNKHILCVSSLASLFLILSASPAESTHRAQNRRRYLTEMSFQPNKTSNSTGAISGGMIHHGLKYFWLHSGGLSGLKRTPGPEDFTSSAAPQRRSHVISQDKNADGEHAVRWFFPTAIPNFSDVSSQKLRFFPRRS